MWVVAIDSVPLSWAEKLLADAPQVTDLTHDHVNAFEHMFARLGHTLKALAVARENFHAKFFFQQFDLLADARLGRVQFGRSDRQVQPLSLDFYQVA